MPSQLSRFLCGVHQRGKILIMPFIGWLGIAYGLEKAGGDLALPQIFGDAGRASLVVIYRIEGTLRVITGAEFQVS
jgi:hypothetical protein